MASNGVAVYDWEKGGSASTLYHSWRISGSPVLEVDAAQALLYGNVLISPDNSKTIGRQNANAFRPSIVYCGTGVQAGAPANTALGASGHFVGTSTSSAGSALLVQNSALTEFLRVRNDGLVSINNAPLDITAPNGYSQLRLRTTYTPTSSADPLGNVGDIAWDGNYFYLKTAAGWRRSAYSAW